MAVPGALVPLDSELLVAAVNEFYSTSDEQRRHEIDTVLCRFKTGTVQETAIVTCLNSIFSEYECVQTVGACMRMISQQNSSPSVRYTKNTIPI